MKRLHYLVGLSILAALLLALVVIMPGSADTPQHTKYYWSEDTTETICDVPMNVHHEGKLEYTMFCNQDECTGDHYAFNDNMTLTYLDRSLNLHLANAELYSWPTEEQTIGRISGARWIGTVPGYGAVWGEAGRVVFWEACPYEGCDFIILHWSGVVFSNYEAICTYMLNGR